MSEALALSFNDPEAGLYGYLASTNDKVIGLGCGRGGANASAIGEGARLAGSAESLEAALDGDEVSYEIEFHGDGPVLALDLGLSTSTLQVTVSLGTAEGTSTTAGASQPIHSPAVSWHFAGLDPSALSVARTVWAELEDGSLLALVAVRETGTDEHGDEHRAGAISSDGEQISFAEPLFSTAYDGAGKHQRTTLELWEADSGVPLRGSGLRSTGSSVDAPHAHVEAAGLDWQIDGAEGIGSYEIVSRA